MHFTIVFIMPTRVVLCEMGIKCLYPLEEHMQRQTLSFRVAGLGKETGELEGISRTVTWHTVTGCATEF